MGGFALQRRTQFDEEFAKLAAACVAAAGGEVRPEREPVAVTEAELARWSKDLFTVALFAYIAAMVASFAFLAFRKRPFATASTVLGIAGLAANVASIVTRAIAAGRTPWGNMYEYSSLSPR